MSKEKHMSYNGWRNYETWNVKLWIDNDQGSCEYWREQTRECWRYPAKNQFVDSHKDRAAIALADRLKDEFEEQEQNILDAAGANASVWADLLGAALSEVDWREIADAMIEDEELTEDDEDTESREETRA